VNGPRAWSALVFLDNASIMELDAVPEHLLVSGGGYIGLEFGQLFRRFGSQITIIQTRERLLTREDPDVTQELESSLRQDGVEILLNAQARRVSPADGDIRLELEQQGQAKTVSGSHLLVATGRVPHSDALNLSAAVLGLEGGEMMAVFEVAMMGRLPCTALRDGIFAHPTLAEALNNLFAALNTGEAV
ncbi:MAG TPA: FAD-dependent oxidoreductase, partial [Candidatus Sulfotelmatobacter sp.]|nr:FAD-dependent oxidoreductase [Candidatus Sulfotelmatobacter sp.]